MARKAKTVSVPAARGSTLSPQPLHTAASHGEHLHGSTCSGLNRRLSSPGACSSSQQGAHRSLGQSRKSLPRGSDNVSATTCDAARDHRQPPHAERAVLSKLIAPVELRTGYVEVRLAADRSGACPRGSLERLKGSWRSRPSSDEVDSFLHTAQLTQSKEARRAAGAARQRAHLMPLG